VLGLQLELELALQGLLELPLVRQQLQLPVRQQLQLPVRQQLQPLERQQLELERPGLQRLVLELVFLLPQELGLLERLQRHRR
jgi:hypothetical protein